MVKPIFFIIAIAALVVISCREDDSLASVPAYIRDWTINLDGSDYPSATWFGYASLPSGKALIHLASYHWGYYLELDVEKGVGDVYGQTDAYAISARDDGAILLVKGENNTSWNVGMYNTETHQADYKSVVPYVRGKYQGTIGSQLLGSFFYTASWSPDTYGYIEQWDITQPEASLRWSVKLSDVDAWEASGITPRNMAITGTDDHTWVAVSYEKNDPGRYAATVYKLSTDGSIAAKTQFDTDLPQLNFRSLHLHENAQGDLFVVFRKTVSKLDSNGTFLWTVKLPSLQGEAEAYASQPTLDGGLLLAAGNFYDPAMLIKVNGDGVETWKEMYTETIASMHALPGGDMLVTSDASSGYITRYKLNETPTP